MRRFKHLSIFLITFLIIPSIVDAQQDTLPKSTVAVTKHQITIDGKPIPYKATAGTLRLRNEKNEPVALFGFTAYTKEGVQDMSSRPIIFAYNGGPGSSSIWLHMGALVPNVRLSTILALHLRRLTPWKTINIRYWTLLTLL